MPMPAEANPIDQEFIAARRSVALAAVFAACFVAFFLAAMLLPHDPYIRYQQLTGTDLFRTRWVYERIHFDPTPIDVAIIGSSRVEAAINAPMLEAFLSAKAGHPVHVANLAIPQEGRNLHYLVAKELLQAHPETRVILLSVVEQADQTHPAFRYLADAKDVVKAPFLINHFYFLDLAFLPYRQMSDFFQSHLPQWFGLSHTFRPDYFGTGFDTTASFRLPSGKLVDRDRIESQPKLEAGSRNLIATYGGAWLAPSAWSSINNPIETTYTQRVVAEAQAHCAGVIFLRLPFYNSPPHFYDEAFYQKLGPLLDLQPLATKAEDFGDLHHFNRHGMQDTTSFLEQQPALNRADLVPTAPCTRER